MTASLFEVQVFTFQLLDIKFTVTLQFIHSCEFRIPSWSARETHAEAVQTEPPIGVFNHKLLLLSCSSFITASTYVLTRKGSQAELA